MRVLGLALCAFAVGCANPPPAEVIADPPDLAMLDLVPPRVDVDLGGPPPTCGATPAVPTSPNAPQLGEPRSLATSPPPVAGGTLLALSDAKTLIAADPDRDVIEIVRLTNGVLEHTATIPLTSGDEPGRAVQDGAGQVHVALRRGGAVVDLDPVAGTLLARRPACAAPRGIAYQASGDTLLVACAGGELISLPAAGGAITRTLQMPANDLRDVVVIGSDIYVSRFRSAELFSLDTNGGLVARSQPVDFKTADGRAFSPSVAWRTIALGGRPLMLHQRGTTSTVNTGSFVSAPPDLGVPSPPPPSGYGGSPGTGGDTCSGSSPIVHATFSTFSTELLRCTASGCVLEQLANPTVVSAAAMDQSVLAVDLAADAGGQTLAVALAGPTHTAPGSDIPNVRVFFADEVQHVDGNCIHHFNNFISTPLPDKVRGQAVAVAFLGPAIAVQSRKPATITLLQPGALPSLALTLDADASDDTGHAIFHSDSGNGIACASCHPEGGDDGRVWSFDFGARRTQSLRGGILPTAPFHWSGDQKDLQHLFGEVFVRRMGGPLLSCAQVDALATWLDRLPLLPHASPDADTVARGQALFESADVGCASCHAGPTLTNNLTVDVGTGGAFQVPSLRGVWARAPYLHHGGARSLTERFTMFGSDAHGHTSQLSPSQIADLVAYLESL